jgi:phospho-N-acetylmuramoyl-pentapeptide-transferase
LLLQALAAGLFLLWAALHGAIASSIALPFGWVLPLGLLIWPLALFVFLAESNATNLTDGLDGLAAGVGAIVFLGLGLQLMLRGNSGDPALAGFCSALAGAWLGFLLHNRNPARIFMGDTGSLAMGAALSAIALLSNSLWPLLLMGGVLLLAADLLARMLLSPQEMPVGVITAVLGGGYLLWLMYRSQATRVAA